MTIEHTQENDIFTGEGENIGRLSYSPGQKLLRLNVLRDDYREAFVAIIDDILEQGEFKVEFDKETMVIKNASPLLHQALRQEALSLLGVITN